jgi:hypothetical protein
VRSICAEFFACWATSLSLAILVLVSVTWVHPTDAEDTALICGSRDAAVAKFIEDFDEQVTGRGLSKTVKPY